MTANLILPEQTIWPPHYTLRRSPRAKNIHLRITPHTGLEIVVPHLPRRPEVIHDLLQTHKIWIEKTLHKYNMQRGQPQMHPATTQLNFTSFNQSWQINYLKLAGEKVFVRRAGVFQLACIGAIENIPLKLIAFRSWLNKRGKELLIPRLQHYSDLYQLPFNQCQIRYQKTRWGSCSARKLICLNHKLLFLPEHLIRYVMIHELCHTIHLNHSGRFWQLVAKFDPQVEQHRHEMRDTTQWIPPELR